MEYIYFAEKAISTLEKSLSRSCCRKVKIFNNNRYIAVELIKENVNMQKIEEWRTRKEARGKQEVRKQGIDEGKEFEKFEKMFEQKLEKSEKKIENMENMLENMLEKMLERK